MLKFMTSSNSEERMRKPHIDFEFEMDHDMYHVYYEVIRFNIYLHYYYYFFYTIARRTIWVLKIFFVLLEIETSLL